MVYDDLQAYSSKDDFVVFRHQGQELIGEIIGLATLLQQFEKDDGDTLTSEYENTKSSFMPSSV